MNLELQLKIAKEYWETAKGRPDVSMWPDTDETSEEKLATIELLRKGVLKKSGMSFFISPETKKFLDNDGKTELELEREKEEQRENETLKVAKTGNKIAICSIGISIMAIIISIFALIKQN